MIIINRLSLKDLLCKEGIRMDSLDEMAQVFIKAAEKELS